MMAGRRAGHHPADWLARMLLAPLVFHPPLELTP